MAEIYGELKKVMESLIRDGIIEKKDKSKTLKRISEAFSQQMRTRYEYLVGKWRVSKVRSKSAKTGNFVSNKEVLEYIVKNL